MSPDNLNKLKASIKRHEGFVAKPYSDTKGNMTIGWGHNLSANGLKTQYCELLLADDIEEAFQDAKRFVTLFPALSEPRQAVIIEMVFNIGVERLLGFRAMLDALKAEDYSKAAEEMLNSEWSREVGTRANDLAHVMESGVM